MIRLVLMGALLVPCVGCTLPALDPRDEALPESAPAGRDWALVAAGPFRTQEQTTLVAAVRGTREADPTPPVNGFVDGAPLSAGAALETTEFFGFQVTETEGGSRDPGVQPPRIEPRHAFRPLEKAP